MTESAEWVSLNGRIVPAADARVSVFDAGFMQGVGLFETMRAYQGRVFRVAAHVERLTRSAAALGWNAKLDTDEIQQDVSQLLWHSGLQDARVRMTVTSGPLRKPIDDERGAEPTIVITATPGAGYPEPSYRDGVAAIVSTHRQSARDPLAGHKTTSYFGRLAALRGAHAVGASECLWLAEDGTIAEGSISNLFVVINGTLRTPPLDAGILPGITRGLVLQLARTMEIAVAETRIAVAELRAAAEAFLTNSMMEVLPLTKLGGRALGDGRPGPTTTRLLTAYRDQVREECEDHD